MVSGKEYKPNKLTLVALLVSSMLMLMGGAAVAPALPLINDIFPGQDFLVSLIITLPSLVIAIVGFGMGALADKFGKVRVLTLSLALFTVSGVISFFFDNLTYILVARAVLGVGLAGVSTTVTALIAEYYTGINRVKVMSYQSAAIGIGILLLEYTGGTLAEISWKEPFLVYLIGLPMMLLVMFSMKEPITKNDSSGLAPAVKANGKIIIACYLAAFLMCMMSFLMPTKSTFYLEGIGVSASMMGLFLGIHGVVNCCFSLMYRRFSTVIPPFKLMSLGFILMGIGLCIPMFDGSVEAAVGMLLLTGMAMGMITPSVVNTLATQVTNKSSGKIMGGYATCLNLGQFSISIISVPLLAMVGQSYPMMFASIGIIAFILVPIYLSLGLRFDKTL